MVRYFYAWAPLAVVAATAVTLTIPYLALVVLLIVAVAALAGLAWAAVAVPYKLGRAIIGRLHGETDLTPQPAPVLSPATQQSAWRPVS
ncbi:MAG TPA: hypothetical protein VFB17_04455 [Gaiellaceae bacterium]|nr:hypothetical protein [Gaiellaceae bacterium]